MKSLLILEKYMKKAIRQKEKIEGLGLNNVRKILANYGTMFLETELQGNRFYKF